MKALLQPAIVVVAAISIGVIAQETTLTIEAACWGYGLGFVTGIVVYKLAFEGYHG